MNFSRKTITNLLATHLDAEAAQGYERAIFDMCCRIDNAKTPTLTTYKEMAYQKVGEILDANDKNERLKRYRDVKKDVRGWKSSAYSEPQRAYQQLLSRSVQKPEAVKDTVKCKNKQCDSFDFYKWSQQTRSGDEGMTHFRQCRTCGKRDRE
jgi:DNA-directed RNA polymerase subunit M/transcription elongation factor TFIIS